MGHYLNGPSYPYSINQAFDVLRANRGPTDNQSTNSKIHKFLASSMKYQIGHGAPVPWTSCGRFELHAHAASMIIRQLQLRLLTLNQMTATAFSQNIHTGHTTCSVDKWLSDFDDETEPRLNLLVIMMTRHICLVWYIYTT